VPLYDKENAIIAVVKSNSINFSCVAIRET
jgi:hypothetical protein